MARQDGTAREVAIMWFRQDLRIADNAALCAAAGEHAVCPVFVLDDETPGAWAHGGAARWWLHHALAALEAALARLGLVLTLRRGRWEEVIPALAREAGAAAIHAGRLHEPWARRADETIAARLAAEGRALHLHPGATLFDLGAIRSKAGGVYGVYAPFRAACHARGDPPPPLPAPRRLIPAPPLRSETRVSWGLLPTRPDWAGGLRETWTPGEAGARSRLDRFLSGALAGYDRARNLPSEAGTSMLSPHLHWGEISPAAAWHAATHAAGHGGGGLGRFRAELIWREFSAYLLLHHPALPERPLRARFAKLRWREDPAALRAWRRGRTGIPIVDAGMRQLWHTGWMHNRVRMIAASFLVKQLLLPWQAGEAWFWDTLVDADLATNGASWQWVAGCGTDAQPYFRVFNPVLQGRTHDPAGDYVRRHLPELARLPARHIHAPWRAPAEVLDAAGVRLGGTYPRPVVDLVQSRARALAAYRSAARGEDASAGAA